MKFTKGLVNKFTRQVNLSQSIFLKNNQHRIPSTINVSISAPRYGDKRAISFKFCPPL